MKEERLEIQTELDLTAARLEVIENMENEMTQDPNENVSMINVNPEPVIASNVNAETTNVNAETTNVNAETTNVNTSVSNNINTRTPNISTTASVSAPASTNMSASTSELAKAFADSVNLNRLPIPEPNVFTGDPLQFFEWKTSFKLLIESKNINNDDKIFYLKKYVSGEAKQAISGLFYGGTERAYDVAMDILNERFGHPFIVQRAFRTKLENWPNIPARNPRSLRDFADFLRACKDMNETQSNLESLNDYSENRKLVKKLPEWVATKWNREVQKCLENDGSYPKFEKFVDFVNKEARIACNPVTSPYFQQETKKNSQNVKSLSTHGNETRPRNETSIQCLFCKRNNHVISDCRVFVNKSIEEKRDFVAKNGLCYGCLKNDGHVNKTCKQKLTCKKCKLKHPTCMHEERNVKSDKVDQGEAKDVSSLRVNNKTRKDQNMRNSSTSMIVPVWVSSENEPYTECLTYALLDTQSDTSFILEDTAKTLPVSSRDAKLCLSTMTSQKLVTNCRNINGLMVRAIDSDERVRIDSIYTTKDIPVDRAHIPTREKTAMWPHLADISNKVSPLQSCDVGLLLGYNCPKALAPLQTIQGDDNQPYAVRTVLGWSVVGCTDSRDCFGTSCFRTQTKEMPPLTPYDAIKVLETDFAHGSSNDVKVSQEDVNFLKIMENIVQRDDDQLEMPLPFKEGRPTLPNNKSAALVRLSHLKGKLQRDNEYYEKYKQAMNDMIQGGDAEAAPETPTSNDEWYIPHHGVFHPKKPGKLRVVFDCSAKYKQTSLNEHLLTGPDLTNGLAGVLVRFRRFPVAVMCDIEKMFHQFFVHEPDRNFLKFVWWENGDLNSEPKDFRMRKHLFGATSSPGCANYGLKHVAKQHEEEFPVASDFIRNDFYVDDGLTSVKTDAEAVRLVQDAKQFCSKAGIRLHKFVSNSEEVNRNVPECDKAENVRTMNLSCGHLPVERALGLLWDVERDIFQCCSKSSNDTAPTRRNMLSVVASIFDPLGFLSPVTLTGKKILQYMCQKGVGWDDELSSDKEWNNWIQSLNDLNNVQIPRCLIPEEFHNNTEIELHHFSDASSSGYGQCSYIRLVNENKVRCALLVGKARVAPLNVVTIPRLELTAAVLSVKMSLFLKKELNLPVDREYFWTDSRVVLGYISNEARRFHDNPADHASRGLSPTELQDSTWFTGPAFLWQSNLEPETVNPELQLGDPEVKSTRCLHTETEKGPNVLVLLERFSKWSKAVAIIARLQRLANGKKGLQAPTVEERRNAEVKIIKTLQEEAFQDTIRTLRSGKAIPRSNNLYPLDPVLHDGVLRVGTRLQNSNLAETRTLPIILPRNSKITSLIVAYAHGNIQHQGRGFTLNKLRSMGYWVIGGSKMVANFIGDCVVCRKLRRPTECQKMADLPSDRVEEYPPFTYCGMDCFAVKLGRREVKRYGLLFTCLCSRAVHIEMLDDMSTDAFINSLRCFMAIRGTVRQIRSDQGSNFIGAKNELSSKVNVDKVVTYLAEKQCDFLLNAPSASHTGGVWERPEQ